MHFFQDEQKEEKNGHLILEEFLDAECGDEDDDDSAWEDVDEEEEDHAEGDDKHTCGKALFTRNVCVYVNVKLCQTS